MSKKQRPPEAPSPETREAILREVSKGQPPEKAAVSAGVDVSVWREWMQRGRTASKGPWADLLRSVQQAQIVAYLRVGNFLETSASAAGVTRQAVRNWIRDGQRDPSGVHGEFARQAEAAMADAEVRGVVAIQQQAAVDWRAAAWMLERTRPERFGQTVLVQTKVEQELDAFLERLREELDPATYERVLAIVGAPADSGDEAPPDSGVEG